MQTIPISYQHITIGTLGMDWGVGRRYGQTAADTPHPVSHSWCGREKYGQ